MWTGSRSISRSAPGAYAFAGEFAGEFDCNDELWRVNLELRDE